MAWMWLFSEDRFTVALLTFSFREKSDKVMTKDPEIDLPTSRLALRDFRLMSVFCAGMWKCPQSSMSNPSRVISCLLSCSPGSSELYTDWLTLLWSSAQRPAGGAPGYSCVAKRPCLREAGVPTPPGLHANSVTVLLLLSRTAT